MTVRKATRSPPAADSIVAEMNPDRADNEEVPPAETRGASCPNRVQGKKHGDTNTVNVVGKATYLKQIMSLEKKWEGRPYKGTDQGVFSPTAAVSKRAKTQLERADEEDTFIMRESRFKNYPRLVATIAAKRIYPTLRAMVEE